MNPELTREVSTAVPEGAPASLLKNFTFDELKVGESASLLRIVGRDDIDLFAAVSGDVNPAHLDATFAATDLFGHVVAHGMWTAALGTPVMPPSMGAAAKGYAAICDAPGTYVLQA